MCTQMCTLALWLSLTQAVVLSSISQNYKFGMLWFGEDISNKFDRETEERVHQEAVLDSLLFKYEILAPARVVNTFSASDFHNP